MKPPYPQSYSHSGARMSWPLERLPILVKARRRPTKSTRWALNFCLSLSLFPVKHPLWLGCDLWMRLRQGRSETRVGIAGWPMLNRQAHCCSRTKATQFGRIRDTHLIAELALMEFNGIHTLGHKVTLQPRTQQRFVRGQRPSPQGESTNFPKHEGEAGALLSDLPRIRRSASVSAWLELAPRTARWPNQSNILLADDTFHHRQDEFADRFHYVFERCIRLQSALPQKRPPLRLLGWALEKLRREGQRRRRRQSCPASAKRRFQGRGKNGTVECSQFFLT